MRQVGIKKVPQRDCEPPPIQPLQRLVRVPLVILQGFRRRAREVQALVFGDAEKSHRAIAGVGEVGGLAVDLHDEKTL
jgi:hypothetical protein